MERSKADSFTAYLEYKQRLDKQQRSAPATGGTAFSILEVLAGNAGQGMTAPELQAASGMSLLDFAEALKRLRDSGYVTVSGDPGHEIVELTRLGADTASLVRPT